MKQKVIVAAAIIALTAVMAEGAAAASTTADVTPGASGYIATVSAYLKVKKAELEKAITATQSKEQQVEQSPIGQQINDVTGQQIIPPAKPKGTPADTLQRLAEQLYLSLLIVAIFILDHALALYSLLALIALYLLRLVWRLFWR